MKKFFGGLMVALGLSMVCVFFFLSTRGLYYAEFLPVIICGLLAVAGLIVFWNGRRLYRSGEEGPTAKKVSGLLILLTGIVLVIIGIILFLPAECYDWVAGAVYFALGLILILAGALKRRAGKKAAFQKAAAAAKAAPQAQKPAEPVQPEPPKEPAGMVCPDCGKKYPPGQVYCDECGALLKNS